MPAESARPPIPASSSPDEGGVFKLELPVSHSSNMLARSSLQSQDSSVRRRLAPEGGLFRDSSSPSTTSLQQRLNRNRSSVTSPGIRGLSIVPRRMSGVVRSDSIDLGFLRKVYIASRPPREIHTELGRTVERVFRCVPKLISEYCAKTDYREVEIILSRKSGKLISLIKLVSLEEGMGSCQSVEGLDELLTEPTFPPSALPQNQSSTWKDISWWKGKCRRGVSSVSRTSSLRRSHTFNEWVDQPEFAEWLVEFLFLLWYSCDRTEIGNDECSIRPGSVRQICKQIVFRARNSQGSEKLSRKAASCWQKGLVFLPWRCRLFLGEKGPMGETSWASLYYEPFDRDSLRRTILALSSTNAGLHWLTREFQDPSVEKAFQVDFAARRLRSPYWIFFLTNLLVIAYVFVQYGLIKTEYATVTLVRLFITEPVTWLIIASIFQLASETVLFNEYTYFQENYFFIQFLQSMFTSSLCVVWMYEIRNIFTFVAWPANEGFTMAFVLMGCSFLFYVRFIWLLDLIAYVAVFTVSMRYLLLPSDDPDINSDFPLQQTIAIMAALVIVVTGRYMFETHARIDFILARTLFLESERSDRLLRNILPEQVIQHLKDNDDHHKRHTQHQGTPDEINSRRDSARPSVAVPVGIAEAYDNVSILFADVCGFTSFSAHISPEELVLFLNELFTCFDDIAEEAGLEKIKTIGDAYLAISGVPDRNPKHAVAAVKMGLAIVKLMQKGQFRDHENKPLCVRVGIHSGACVAGVIGRKKFIYDIWGDAVNTASRMESTGEANVVHISEETARLLKTQDSDNETHAYVLEPRGDIEIKGKGKMSTFFVYEEVDRFAPSIDTICSPIAE